MTLTAVIRRMDESSTKSGGSGWRDNAGKVITAHGFRSTFRDWAGETTAYPREVIEHALAHQLKDSQQPRHRWPQQKQVKPDNFRGAGNHSTHSQRG